MTNDVDIKLIGDKELLAVLQDLDYKTQHRYLKRVISHAANIYVKAAKRRVPVRRTKLTPTGENWHPPGAGKRSIIKKVGRSRRVATYFVGPRGGPRRDPRSAWYLQFPEHGTKRIHPYKWVTVAYAANKDKVEKSMASSLRTIIERAWRKAR